MGRMSNSDLEASSVGAEASPDRLAALFQSMVLQQANMAMMFLGLVPHPETGETTVDLNAARFFIDQLEMLEVKTKGNLNRNEEAVLKQHLMSLRMTFVRAADQASAKPREASPSPAASEPAPAAGATPPDTSAAPSSESESRKKFTKKY